MISYSDWLDNNIDRLSDKYDTYLKECYEYKIRALDMDTFCLEEFEDMLSEIEDRAYDDYKDERL
jgi:hypothetical protein